MARSYARLLVSLWTDSDFRALKASPQRLYMALLSNPKLSTAGCLPWQVNKWANLAADLTAQQVTDDLNALAAGRFILCDAITEEVLIRSFIRHDGGVRNPNLLKSIESAIVAIESPRLRAAATAELAKAQRTDSEPGRTGGPGPGRTEGPEQAATEPTYIPHPSSLIPERTAASASRNTPSGPAPRRLRASRGEREGSRRRCPYGPRCRSSARISAGTGRR